jgi:hypothetical protein
MVDMDDVSVLVSLAAVGAAVWALTRGGRTVVNVPDDFGNSMPDELQDPRDDNVTVPSDDGPDETVDTGGGSDIPDSLADFDPAGRVDLIGGDVSGSDNDRPWVGL